MTREERADAIRDAEESVDHALREVERAMMYLEDIGANKAVMSRLETIHRKLIFMLEDLYLFS